MKRFIPFPVAFAMLAATLLSPSMASADDVGSTQQGLVSTQSTPAAPGEFPASVALRTLGANRPDCSGSLIDPEWVLTAAHCVVDDNDGQTVGGFQPDQLRAGFQLIIGATNAAAGGAEIRNPVQLEVHPGYVANYATPANAGTPQPPSAPVGGTRGRVAD